ncbi:MAG: SDR family oxidoreductase [Acidobacteria bacterium]|nr:SDR family oxidoreductase [Acidobacteriota bacterium]
MDMQLENKVVLIAGGAKGIGAAIANSVAAEGGISVIVDRDAAAGNKLCEDIGAQGKRCGKICTDLSSAGQCAEAVEQTLREFGALDVLVNNAEIDDTIELQKGSPAEFESSVNKSISHYYNVAHFALHALKKSRGCIVNIASKTATTGYGVTSGYAAAKGAILALTREWAVELLPYGIRVNAVLPAEGKRLTRPEEIAATSLFLMSAQASHITGQHIFVDGRFAHPDRAQTSAPHAEGK